MAFGREHVGKRVKLRRDVRTLGGVEFSAGQELVIMHVHRTFHLQDDNARQVRLRRSSFDILPEVTT